MAEVVRDKDKGYSRIVSTFENLKESYVKVGLQGKTGNAVHKESEFKTVIEIGATHEFGSPEERIPERSFLRGTFDANKKNWVSFSRQLLEKTLFTRGFSRKALDTLGLRLQTDIKKFIRKGIPPPNSAATIEAKRKRKPGRVIPLIDTGQMINSITYQKFWKSLRLTGKK